MGIGDIVIGDGTIGDADQSGQSQQTPEHFPVLKKLFPIDLGPLFDQDITLEAWQLDALKTSGTGLENEMFPDTAIQTIADWERRYEISPSDGQTPDQRRQAVVQKKLLQGRQDVYFFIQLAAAAGYTVDIEELPPNSPGYGPESIFIMMVHVPQAQKKTITQFSAGDSAAGDLLTDWPSEPTLEQVLLDNKPGHVDMRFIYQ